MRSMVRVKIVASVHSCQVKGHSLMEGFWTYCHIVTNHSTYFLQLDPNRYNNDSLR